MHSMPSSWRGFGQLPSAPAQLRTTFEQVRPSDANPQQGLAVHKLDTCTSGPPASRSELLMPNLSSAYGAWIQYLHLWVWQHPGRIGPINDRPDECQPYLMRCSTFFLLITMALSVWTDSFNV